MAIPGAPFMLTGLNILLNVSCATVLIFIDVTSNVHHCFYLGGLGKVVGQEYQLRLVPQQYLAMTTIVCTIHLIITV